MVYPCTIRRFRYCIPSNRPFLLSTQRDIDRLSYRLDTSRGFIWIFSGRRSLASVLYEHLCHLPNVIFKTSVRYFLIGGCLFQYTYLPALKAYSEPLVTACTCSRKAFISTYRSTGRLQAVGRPWYCTLADSFTIYSNLETAVVSSVILSYPIVW